MKTAIYIVALFLSLTNATSAQTSAFTYQGKLTESGSAANGQYDLQFRLWDITIPVAGPIEIEDVQVTNGVFTVQIDFGAAAFPESDRYIEIGVRPGTSTGGYTLLSPKQRLTSSPYSVKASSAINADALGGVAAENYVLTGSTDFIRNGAAPQSASFNISGDGKVSGALRAGIVGVGVDVPLTKLHVIDEGNSGLRVQTDTKGGKVASFGGYGAFEIDAAGTAGGRLTVTEDGKVGIGVANPTQKLEVSGNIAVSGTVSGNGAGLTNINGANIATNSIPAAALAPSQELTTSSTNLSRLGMLRWDLLKKTMSTGSAYLGAFDGANIWVGDFGGTVVSKIRASDMAFLGNFTVGSGSGAVAFDGNNVWVANGSSNTVTKLRASDGANLGTFPTGSYPSAIIFDGTNIWVTNGLASAVQKIRPSDGAVLATYTVGTNPRQIAFDGTNIWVTNFAGNDVTKLRASDGAFQATITVTTSPIGIAFDGGHMWIAQNSGRVAKVRATDNSILATYLISTAATGVAFDGSTIWVAAGSNMVYRLRTGDGVILASYSVPGSPEGLIFDGSNMWVASPNGSVTKLSIFQP